MYSSSGAVDRAASRRGKRSLQQIIRLVCYQLRSAARPVGLTVCLFLLTFVRWFGIPSPFAAAFLLAFAGKPSPLYLAGLGASLLLRLLWGIEPDWWQYAGCAGLWLLLQKCHPKAGVETAALGGLAMMPRILAALAAEMPLDILLSCAALPLCMLFAVLLRYGMDAAASTGGALRGWERFCLLLLGLMVISGLGYFWIGNLNLGQLAAVVAALVYALPNGPVHGAMGGLLCGIALALGGHDSRVALSLSLCGLCGGLPLIGRKRWLAIGCVGLANVMAWFVTPLAHPPLAWWAAATGAVLFGLMPVGMLEKLKPYLHAAEMGERSMENAFVTQRIAHMRTAIENLARALPDWEEESSTSGEELGAVLCVDCAKRELCWGRSRSRTEKMLTGMMETIAHSDQLNSESVPLLGTQGCMRAEEAHAAAAEVNSLRKKRRASLRKARYERELTLTHLAALSGTLGDLGTMAAGESFHDLRAAHVITLALEELRVPARLIYARRVDGHLQAALEAEGVMPLQKALDTLLRYLSKEEDLPLSIARMEKGRIELEEVPLYSASIGMASMCAGGDADGICGDACCAKRCEGGRLLMMLCDGMGHGEAAHRQSEKTLELLLLLLEAGYTRHQAISAVNGIMLGVQAEERFSTVDLADVDLWTGDVYGEKLGACPTWVVRGSHMKKVEASSLPLGIVQEARPTAAQYRLHSGDILVLMSDGMADVFENDEQMKKALEDSLYIQPQRMADALLRNALIAGGGSPRDDMTVMVLLLMNRRHTS